MGSLRTVAEVDEGQLLELLLPTLPAGAGHPVGNGDDAAVLAIDSPVVASTDILVEGRDFLMRWPCGLRTTGEDVGFKAAAQNLSDLNAMGADPASLLLTLSLPGSTPIDWVLGLGRGVSAAIEELGAAGCGVAGGDLSGAGEISVSVTALGALGGRAPLLRSDAQTGDTLALAGTVGRAAAGLDLLNSDIDLEGGPDLRELCIAQLRPRPPLGTGRSAVDAGASAGLDVSDGLVRDAGRLATASGVSIDITTEALLPWARPLRPAARALELTDDDVVDRWLLRGAEDFGLLATFPGPVPPGFTAIGSIFDGGAAVTVDGEAPQRRGWDHFAH